MNAARSVLQQALLGWLRFWFPAPAPHGKLALVRIGASLILLYVLFVRSFDLDARLAATIWSDESLRAALDPFAWPFTPFRWASGAWWLWSLHALAMLAAGALLAGVFTPLMAGLSLLFQLSYAHYLPPLQLGVDSLLILTLSYLTLVPSGRVLGVFGRSEPEPPQFPPYLAYLEDELQRPPEAQMPWSGLVVRLLQLHLSVLYVHSALAKLSTDWLAGTPLWHPRLVALGSPAALETLHAVPYLTSLVTYGLVLFELLYGVLIWVPALRYPLLVLAVCAHGAVAIAWGNVPFNLLMLVLNLSFVPAAHLEAFVRFIRPLLVLPWVANEARE